MAENVTLTTEFILTGFTSHQELKILLFIFFLIIYLITIIGNIGLVILISVEPRLHSPMYLFLGNLAFMDTFSSCAVTPKMLMNFFSKGRMISLRECMVQFYFLCFSETSACFLLAVMAYDRYVAICNPLHYPTMMSKKLSIQMITGSLIAGSLHSMIHVGFLFRLTFCKSHQINHFYCDVLPLHRLSCTDPYINQLMIFIISGPIQVFTLGVILLSYLYILLTVFRMKSKEGRGKAFSTCASHFVSVSIFYGSLLIMYIRPGALDEGAIDIPVAIFYTIVIPFLNPFIYSLRNKDVISVLRKIMEKKISGGFGTKFVH
ncbi:olfactory receptor 5K1-like [Notamacropus eugenii]|uniref:olfactory receptor 5K1-like n=1 Tax=Notamacropus eugenii TaxID=9315 RepID=UPI003B685E68